MGNRILDRTYRRVQREHNGFEEGLNFRESKKLLEGEEHKRQEVEGAEVVDMTIFADQAGLQEQFG